MVTSCFVHQLQPYLTCKEEDKKKKSQIWKTNNLSLPKRHQIAACTGSSFKTLEIKVIQFAYFFSRYIYHQQHRVLETHLLPYRTFLEMLELENMK
jgi:hypothetical protein